MKFLLLFGFLTLCFTTGIMLPMVKVESKIKLEIYSQMDDAAYGLAKTGTFKDVLEVIEPKSPSISNIEFNGSGRFYELVINNILYVFYLKTLTSSHPLTFSLESFRFFQGEHQHRIIVEQAVIPTKIVINIDKKGFVSVITS